MNKRTMAPKRARLTGEELARILVRRLGYVWVHQRGSHIKLSIHRDGGDHAQTIPNHRELKQGTLHGIVGQVATRTGRSRQDTEAIIRGKERELRLSFVRPVEKPGMRWVFQVVFPIKTTDTGVMPAMEITFLVTADPADGGFVATAVGYDIVTQGDTLDEVRAAVLDAVACYFEARDRPGFVHLHIVQDEMVPVGMG